MRGDLEEIKTKLFDEVQHPRTIRGKGKLIQIYDPRADMGSAAYWEWEKENEFAEHDVPPGYKVRVVGGTIAFI